MLSKVDAQFHIMTIELRKQELQEQIDVLNRAIYILEGSLEKDQL